MGRFPAVLILLGSILLFVQGCSDGGGGDSVASAISDDPSNNPPATEVPDGSSDPVSTIGVGELGTLIDLGDLLAFSATPPPGDHWYFTRAAGINDAGTVIGQSNQGSPVKGAFKWEPATETMTFLGIHPGVYEDFYNQFLDGPIDPTDFIYSEAVDINSSGVIAGNSTTGTGWPNEDQKRAFVWNNGEFIDLHPVPALYNSTTMAVDPKDPSDFSEAADINDKGQVVFTASDGTENRHAYFWDGVSYQDVMILRDDDTTFIVNVPGPYTLLGSIVGASSEAVAINENGQTVINSGGTAVFHDLNWNVVESLNHLPGATFTAAVDINDSAYTNNDGIVDGHIIGNSGSGFDPSDLETAVFESDVQGFFWDGGAMYPVDHLGGGASVATDINNSDQVVGGATTADGLVHAYLWTLDENEKGTIRDLGTLGGANSFATAINEAGQVTGWAETGVFYEEEGVVLPIRHAFLWDDGVMYDLGTHNYFYDYAFVPSYPFSEGVGINATAEVAGNSITINEHYRGFFLSPVFP